MKQLLLLFLLAGSALTSTAQDPALNCGDGRYVENKFADVTKTTGVTFGFNTSKDYVTQATFNHELKFDFYEPTGDLATKRPLIILLFGGGFISGTRADMDPICIALARKGYATATIDYRLINNNFLNIFTVFNSNALLTDEVVKAASDLKAAIRYFKRDAATTNLYKIDPTKIIVGGASAGSIAALMAAYTDDATENPSATAAYLANGGIEGNTDLPAPNNLLPAYNASGIAAVLNIAGGVGDTSLIDANNPPIYSSQGTADEVVPYNYGPIAYNGFASPTFLYGSNLITTRANNIGLKNVLYPIPDGGHESPGGDPYIGNIINGSAAFLQTIVCAGSLPVTLTNFKVESKNCTAILRWQTATEQQSSHYDVETSLDGVRFTKVATIKSRNIINGATYIYDLKGYTQAAWFRLKLADKDGSFTYSPMQKLTPSCVASLQVYPNPAQSQATVGGLQTGMQVHLINAEGKLLWSQRASGNTLQIPLTKFAKGVLLVQVKDSNGQVLTNSKLIKN
jgi:predicted esterase